MDGLKDLSEIEQLKILKSIRLGCSNEAEFEAYVKNHLGEEGVEEVIRRIDGLLFEDEFLLLCKLMKSCIAINGLDQSFAIDNGFKVPDYLVAFNLSNTIYDLDPKPAKISAFVEVKTTKGSTNKIGSGFLNKYSKYAELYDLPLIFASRLKINERRQCWVLQTEEQLKKSKNTSTPKSLGNNSVGHLLLNDYLITPTVDIFLDLEFTKIPTTTEFYSNLYGYLKSITMTFDGSRIVLDEEMLPFGLFLECFPQEIIFEKKHGAGFSVRRWIQRADRLLSEMVLRANYFMLDLNGDYYSSASRLLALLENDMATEINREFFDSAISYFNSAYPLFEIIRLGNEENNQKLMNALLGTEAF
jgi:hypothetical protein